jgi:pimeloyl-ACP methyl ester carboxylesterase
VRPLPEPAPVAHIPTGDGASAAVVHHPGPGAPVLLIHGISSNSAFWDLAPGRSLARDLQRRGFDVWNGDLRGHGHAFRDADGRRPPGGWTVDDLGQHDLPALLDHVRRQTGHDRPHVVVHSMGGMVLAVHLAAHPDDPGIASAVVVGSPLDFSDPDPVLEAALGLSGLFWTRTLPTRTGARFLARRERGVLSGLRDFLYAPENMAPDAARMLLRRVVSPLARGEFRQLARSRRHDGAFVSADGDLDYASALGGVRIPMLFLAGRADRIVHPDRVRAYYEAVGSEVRAFHVLSRAAGDHADYGHLDLGAGDHAAQDVYPRIAGWLIAHPARPTE